MTFRSLMKLTAAAISIMSGAAYAQQVPTAYFAFIETHQKTRLPHEFVFAVTNPIVIQRLRDILDGTYQESDVHINGKIILSRADYNEEWPFHLDPNTVDTFNSSIEHCDADPFEIEDHLSLVGRSDPDDPDAGFLTDYYWCPYDSRLIREVKYPGGGEFGPPDAHIQGR